MFGPYVPEAEVARGARAVVLRARHPDGRQVALKLLLGASATQRERFGRERALLAELDETKGFVSLLDVLDTPHGPCLVMPFLPGGTLRERITNRGMAIHEVTRLGRRLAGSLGRAHARGIVHRDLKPDNVLFDARGEALIADLGLAKHWGESSRVDNTLTRSGELHGTPGYMAPEQIASARDVGPATDVFALGVILYECLTGSCPFSGATPLDALARTSTGSFVPLAEARPGTPDWLADIVERCLRAAPAERFEDGASLAAAIAQGPLTRARRGRTPWGLIAGGVGAGALAAVVVLFGGPRGAPEVVTTEPAPVEPAPALIEPAIEPEPAAVEPERAAVEPEPAPVEPAPAPVEPRPPRLELTPTPTPAESPPSRLEDAPEALAPLAVNMLYGLDRLVAPGRGGPWDISVQGDQATFENRADPNLVKYAYATSTHAAPFRIAVEVKLEALPGEPPPMGAGLIYGYDDRTKDYWAFMLAPDGGVGIYRRKGSLQRRASTRSGDPSPDGWRRLEVLEHERGFSLYVDGKRSFGMGGPETAPRRGVGVIVAGKGRFHFRSFAGAKER